MGDLLTSCVVVAFHRPHMIGPLVERLRAEGVETIVVNVEDDPAVAAAAGDCAIPFAQNSGYAAAVNAGVRAARGDVVVFCNDDLELSAADVLALASRVRSGGADVCLPRVLDLTGRIEPTIAALPTPSRLLLEWTLLPDRPVPWLRWLRVEKWRQPTAAERVDAAAAVVVAARTSLLRQVPMSECYFLYWEESDWFWRLRRLGARVTYDPAVTVRHVGGREDVRPDKSVLLARNAVRCVRLTQGRLKASSSWPLVVAWNARLVIVDGLRALLGSRPSRERLRARHAGLSAALTAWREI